MLSPDSITCDSIVCQIEQLLALLCRFFIVILIHHNFYFHCFVVDVNGSFRCQWYPDCFPAWKINVYLQWHHLNWTSFKRALNTYHNQLDYNSTYDMRSFAIAINVCHFYLAHWTNWSVGFLFFILFLANNFKQCTLNHEQCVCVLFDFIYLICFV